MKIRRVVAGTGPDGKARVLMDGPAPRSFEFTSAQGHAAALVWSTALGGAIPRGLQIVDRSGEASFAPGAGESLLMIATFPPDSTMMRVDFDAAAFGAEFAQRLPGLAETFELDHPGMHTTNSIDYDIVLEGEITLELDDGEEVLLRKHDVVVQHGNRHAWRNKSDKPATLMFVLMGTKT